ncbi:sigma-54-dependent Fis family transcriptional regulator [Marinomonas agarivorans]|nr:sigma-54-dependent Fis family transcriptional regulator [Marinomonas agarivorans]
MQNKNKLNSLSKNHGKTTNVVTDHNENTDAQTHQNDIEASWERCRQYGLDPSSPPQIERLTNKGLSDEHHFLIETTGKDILPHYENILTNSQCMIMLADNQGQMIKSWGDQRFLNSQQRASLATGTLWGEQFNGTNAIGTALAVGRAVQVQKDEHYLKSNRFMVGSASPIFNTNNDLLGVLDVSSDTYLPHAHTLGMVKIMSQSIENRLIANMFSEENFLLTFNNNIDNIDSQWAGLLVFNENGIILSANKRAELLLGYDLALQNITDIFDCPLRELKNHPQSMPIELPAMNRFLWHGVIRRPQKQTIQAVDFRQREQQKRQQKDTTITLEKIGFGDPQIDRCINQAKRILEKDIPILIYGETGVGKEVFVNALHNDSSRKCYPLVAVNCAAIPSELVESELFGYEKGAFTGANNKGSIGLIRKAHKGILFLDEIGEMPLNVQARLLRVLQDRKVTPLGSTDSYPIDIKLISATNRSLKSEVETGKFRQDLYYRVSGLNLELPPLRQRTDKAALFTELHHHLRDEQQAPYLSEEILDLFQQHPWPGNIRQLVSVLQIALALAENDNIEAWHLPDDFFADIRQQQDSPSNLKADSHLETSNNITNKLAKKTNHTDNLLAVYQRNNGNISRTAAELGMSRNTLYKRLKELDDK